MCGWLKMPFIYLSLCGDGLNRKSSYLVWWAGGEQKCAKTLWPCAEAILLRPGQGVGLIVL
jgi:hypothetical protein